MELTDSVGTSLTSELHLRAGRYVPGGVHSNSRLRSPHPIFAARASGPYLWDVDGVQYLDLQMGSGSVALGYGRAEVDAAVTTAITAGLTAGVETAAAVEAVEALAQVIPECRSLRFANTGTEALMHAVAISRQATGRDLVAKAEGAYHGWYDPLWVSNWPEVDNAGPADAPVTMLGSAGLPASAERTIVVPFNDLAGTEAVLRAHSDELAVLAIEPVMIDLGYIPATQEYLTFLRAITTELGILLLFDELLTGFRIAPGGAREVYGVIPDLSTYGKAIANGFPLAVVEGREELMARTDPSAGGTVGWVGTYNGHPVGVAAASAAVPLLADGTVQAHLSALTEQLRAGFAELSTRYQIPAVLAGSGGHFQPYFVDEQPWDYRSATRTEADRYRTWAGELAAANILVPGGPLLHCAFSAAHGSGEVETVLEVTERAFARMS
jgi:glutamate-1-semialdehyde 2,1-aminomutase